MNAPADHKAVAAEHADFWKQYRDRCTRNRVAMFFALSRVRSEVEFDGTVSESALQRIAECIEEYKAINKVLDDRVLRPFGKEAA